MWRVVGAGGVALGFLWLRADFWITIIPAITLSMSFVIIFEVEPERPSCKHPPPRVTRAAAPCMSRISTFSQFISAEKIVRIALERNSSQLSRNTISIVPLAHEGISCLVRRSLWQFLDPGLSSPSKVVTRDRECCSRCRWIQIK